ncbi:MAG: DUF1987 domain-containing protein [Bacteroidales bacterium]|jgi:hypothetical protein|nr:DUF1987 domain-containing protein [Bacteroidales bacterium]
MNSLKIESTAITPEINFDIDNNTLSLLKVSKPENAIEFYKPLFDFIDRFETDVVKPKQIDQITVEFKFDYFNTSSAKIIHQLLTKFKKISCMGIKIDVNWYYPDDDEDMLEDGQMISEAQGMPFNYIAL